MSLYKQLWLAILLLLTTVFGVSLLATTLSARAYLEEQLAIKNADNAAALALSLTQQGADYVLLELTLSAQFDTGFYEMIELVDPEGTVAIRRIDDSPAGGAPDWFIRLFPIEVEPGIAGIQAGWQQAGTLTLRSHSRFAYEELWENTLMLAGIFLAAGLVAGFAGNALLKRILRPLDDVVAQAEAIGKHRFITIEEPRTLEFRRLVGAMNELSNHVKQMLAQEARRLQKWQREAHTDRITGLHNREPFFNELSSHLGSNDDSATGGLCLVRVTGLASLNQTYGRKATDNLLRDIGNALNRIVVGNAGWFACRLNGSDFAVLAPRHIEAEALGNRVRSAVSNVVADHDMERESRVPAAVTIYAHRDTVSELLTRLDGALVSAQRERSATVTVAYKGDIPVKPVQQQTADWRRILEKSLADDLFSLARFPVIDRTGALIHYEAPARLEWQGRTFNAGEFLHWITRLQLSGEFDKRIVELGLRSILERGEPVAVNLTVAAVAEPGFLSWLEECLTQHRHTAHNLWFEVPEAMAFRHLENFKRLCARVKARGARMGIEHVGHQLADLGKLHDVGLDYLKVDASFVRDLPANPGNQSLLRSLCTLGHSIGVSMIAEGVENAAEWEAVKEAGMDGGTGPGIRLS